MNIPSPKCYHDLCNNRCIDIAIVVVQLYVIIVVLTLQSDISRSALILQGKHACYVRSSGMRARRVLVLEEQGMNQRNFPCDGLTSADLQLMGMREHRMGLGRRGPTNEKLCARANS